MAGSGRGDGTRSGLSMRGARAFRAGRRARFSCGGRGGDGGAAAPGRYSGEQASPEEEPMAAMSRDDDDMIAGINVTPLVDISLVLLIVFLVTARFLVTPSLDVSLPPAEHASAVQSPLSLELGADGRVLLGGVKAPSDAAIVAAAREAQAK